eukprot:scaffold283163_cov16-Prasinocladus_malaysianus.AAC.1
MTTPLTLVILLPQGIEAEIEAVRAAMAHTSKMLADKRDKKAAEVPDLGETAQEEQALAAAAVQTLLHKAEVLKVGRPSSELCTAHCFYRKHS